jgi:hypothetical protein
MKHAICAAVLFAAATTLVAQSTTPANVADDAIAIDRVAAAAKKDLPTDLLKRIVNEDIDVLRGRRQDGTYAYASYERLEASRVADTFSVQPRADKMETNTLKAAWVYRIVLDVPEHRLVLAKNRPVWVERIDIEYVPVGKSETQRTTIDVKAWLQPKELRPFDLDVVASQATVHVIATADEKTGYGNLGVALIQAKIVDNADSPYADAVASAKAILRGLDNNDIPSIRSMAARMRDSLGVVKPAASVVTVAATPLPPVSAPVAAPPVIAPSQSAARDDAAFAELQQIEDLLTGSEVERREGLDRLHQLIRRMRH